MAQGAGGGSGGVSGASGLPCGRRTLLSAAGARHFLGAPPPPLVIVGGELEVPCDCPAGERDVNAAAGPVWRAGGRVLEQPKRAGVGEDHRSGQPRPSRARPETEILDRKS